MKEKNIRIIADSACDLYTLDYPDFKVIPLSIYTDDRTFIDNPDLNITEMLDYLRQYKGRSYTSCPSIDAYLESYQGADEIFVVTITSALSGSYNSALSAARQYLEDNPNAKVSVIDSLSTGGEEMLLIEKLVELINQGNDFETIDKKIREYLLTTRLFFSFYSVHNLAQNGRINKIVCSAINVLNIAIIGTASSEGKIEVTNKVKGEKKSLNTLFEEMLKANYQGAKAIISHAENESAAIALKEIILNRFPDAEIKIVPAKGLCSYYMERKGIVVCLETQ